MDSYNHNFGFHLKKDTTRSFVIGLPVLGNKNKKMSTHCKTDQNQQILYCMFLLAYEINKKLKKSTC